MRFYVVSIQHNMVADAENRSIPKAYDTVNEAVREFHRQLSVDMSNETLDWAICLVFDSRMEIIKAEKWTREE
jgi:hypothetical protein